MEEINAMTLRTLVLAVALVGLAGCGAKPVAVFPVSGKVVVAGKPVASALVVFHPLGASADAPRPRATTGPDGSFTVTFEEGRAGAPAGTYRVTVEQWLASARADEGPSNRLPAKYAKPESSGLTATVGEKPTELEPFVLKK
jgi:hypothetical protein